MAKVSKSDVDYSPGQPHCGICEHFIPGEDDDKNSTCALVMGVIDEDMWCKLFKPMRQPTLAEGPYK